jgi:hypothetical protein
MHGMTQDDMTTRAASEHDTARTDATETRVDDNHQTEQTSNESETQAPSKHAEARLDTSDQDTARQDEARRLASYTLTIEQIMQRLDVEGVSKSKRTVQRYFNKGEIDVKLVTTSEGQRWLANELDAARFIEDLKRREALALMTRSEGSEWRCRTSWIVLSRNGYLRRARRKAMRR